MEEKILENEQPTEEVVVEEEKKEHLSLAEQRRRSAKRMFVVNLFLMIVGVIILGGGIACLIIGSFGPDMPSWTVAILCLAGVFLLAIGAILTMYFAGHLTQCVRDMKDPERKTAVKDHKI